MANLKNLPEYAVVISLAGTITKDDVMDYKNKLTTKINQHKKICCLVDFSKVSDMTGDAFLEDIKFELSLLSKLDHFSKIAIVSDKQFIKATSKLMQFFMPYTEIEIFNASDMDKAITFVSQLSQKVIPKSEVKFIETNNPRLIAYEVSGIANKEIVSKIIPKFEEAFKQKEKIDLLVRIPNYAGVSPDVFSMKSIFRLKLTAMERIRRYAIVGAPGIIKELALMFSPFVPIEIKTFNLADEDKAWQWLRS